MRIGGELRPGLVALDGSTGIATSWNPTSQPGYGVTVDGSNLYVAQQKNSSGEASFVNYDTTTGIGTEIRSGFKLNGTLATIIKVGNIAYVMGSVTEMDHKPYGGMCAINITTGLSAW
ncbi:hypothetical protein D3C72_2022210 [compost metagenome]